MKPMTLTPMKKLGPNAHIEQRTNCVICGGVLLRTQILVCSDACAFTRLDTVSGMATYRAATGETR